MESKIDLVNQLFDGVETRTAERKIQLIEEHNLILEAECEAHQGVDCSFN